MMLHQLTVPHFLLQHIHYQFKREEIEFPVIHRINSVFRRATNKWKVLYNIFMLEWVQRNCIHYLMYQMSLKIIIVINLIFFSIKQKT